MAATKGKKTSLRRYFWANEGDRVDGSAANHSEPKSKQR